MPSFGLQQFASFGMKFSVSEAADHPATFTKLNIPPKVFLIYYKTKIPKLHNTQCKCFFAFSGNFIIRFSGNVLSQNCSGHHSLKYHVWEKVYLLSDKSKSYLPIRLHDFCKCSVSLITCSFETIQILSLFLLICQKLA